MIGVAGYSAESHKVVTEDGYVLTIYRILGVRDGPPVFLQHGLEGSSALWLLPGPRHGSLAFMLAAEGYDVWLGNFRGNHESREHVNLDPDVDSDYWQFSWDEMAKYDLPAMLNHVLTYTEKEKLHFVGHSMGSTTFMVLNSLEPNWGDHIGVAVLLAPVAYIDHTTSPIRLIAEYSQLFQWVADHMGPAEFLPSTWFLNLMADYGCGDHVLEILCENILFLFSGYDGPQMNQTLVPAIASHTPAGTSTYTVLQFVQSAKRKSYGGYDWGSEEKNLLHHGSPQPPSYSLKNVTAKVAIIWGDNDILVEAEDLAKIQEEIPNVVMNFKVPWKGWNHLDFLFGMDADKLQNHHILQLLRKNPL